MFQQHYAASTTNTYVSALGYCHRLAGFPDPTKVCFIVEMLKGYNKLGFRIDSRLPITSPILTRILEVSGSILPSNYWAHLFNAMCTTAFYGFLRIGEVATTSPSCNVLQLNQVSKLVNDLGVCCGFQITLSNYKHCYNQRPFSISLTRRPEACPVQTLLSYLQVRGGHDGPLFQTLDGLPISRRVFNTYLSRVIRTCGLEPSRYKGHSFRIGAASHAAQCGYSDNQIRLMGRWRSDAFKKYIRTPSLNY